MKSEINSKQSAFEAEMNIDWNGSVVSRSEKLLEESLDWKFGSSKQ